MHNEIHTDSRARQELDEGVEREALDAAADVKTVGVVGPLKRALESRAGEVRAAFVYGSVAKGTDTARSDIDLMVISDRLHHADLFEMLQPVEGLLARRVNPTVMSRREWRSKRSDPDSFAARVAAGPRLLVIGADGDLD